MALDSVVGPAIGALTVRSSKQRDGDGRHVTAKEDGSGSEQNDFELHCSKRWRF